MESKVIGKVGNCTLNLTIDAAGKAHFEAECLSKEARDELAAIFEEEAILRVNPKVILQEIADTPPTEPPAEPPAAVPVTES